MARNKTVAFEPAHQFETAEQQYRASSMGMWVFLVTEIMFFGGLFTGFAVYNGLYGDLFRQASHTLSILLGSINTAVLIGSSLTMALAVRAGKMGKKGQIIATLIATMILGTVFLGIKAYEYHHKWVDHLIPGAHFAFEGLDGMAEKNIQLFFSFYFVMTGFHALHMVIGMGLMIWLLVKASRNQFSTEYSTPIEMVGLYWHFVDLVWIYLFPILYLIGRHG